MEKKPTPSQVLDCRRIVLIRSNSIYSDPRVSKEATSLGRAGYNVLVLGWDREKRHRKVEKIDGFYVRRLRLKAPYGKYWLALLYPIFWTWAFVCLLITKPSVVHACDLDTAIPSYLYVSVCRRAMMAFDLFDNFALAFIDPRQKILYSLVSFIENLFVTKADVVFVVSEERLRFVRGARSRRVVILMNCPAPVKTYSSRFQTSDKFRIVYAGPILRERGLVETADATDSFTDVEFVIAGNIVDRSLLKALVKHPQVKYVGKLSYEDALSLESTADTILMLYNPAIPINRVASPNKLFEAMMFSIPVLTNVVKNIITEVGCGVVVDYNDVDSIKKALSYIKDHSQIRSEMGWRGQKAFKEKYNWHAMERKLLEAYAKLLVGSFHERS